MGYFSCASMTDGVRYKQLPWTIGAADRPGYIMPVGQAHQVGKTADGLALWRLTVHGAEVPGRFIVVDGRFVLVDDAVD
jgi:hypothetical protein